MALKPIGSEKLTGQDKINRIMEIATYGETEKNTAYHTQTLSFSKKASDGNTYAIIQEKDGYYLKRGINESELDYIDGINNKKRNRFKSYGAALKRMNLIFKPLNEEFNNGESTPLYEQSDTENKFVLKTPEAEVDVTDVTTDEVGGEDELDFGDDELEMDDEELAMDDEEVEVDSEETEEEMEGFMKPIQKLTGKLGQKLRDAGEELGSADIKYVLNSVISAVDLDNLDSEDRDDVLSRFEEDEAVYGDEEIGDEELAMDDEELDADVVDLDFGDDEMEDEEELAMESLKGRVSQILESYVKKQTPKEYLQEKLNKNKINESIKKLSRSIEQELSVKKYLNENKYSKLKGLTKKGEIVILSDDKNIFIKKDGSIK
jgi:hypothetical protein